jgi:transcriptional regulator with XRE-family HTH domain
LSKLARPPTDNEERSALDRHIGRRVTLAREAKGMSVAELVSAARIDPIALTLFETGKRRVPAPALYALADALGLPIAHFFDDLSPQ